MTHQPIIHRPPLLQVLHEPLMVLADDSGGGSSSTAAGVAPEVSLHCGYAWCGVRSAAALAWTDSRGELVHCRLLELPDLDIDCVQGAEELCGEVLAATLKVRG